MNDKPYIKVLLLIATSTLLLTGCASTEITQTKTDTTVELGSACNLNITDFFELGSKVNTSDILIDTSSVDANTIGDYEATVTYKKNTYKINVSVIDTTAPIVTAKTDMEPVELGTTIKASDYVEVTDLSGYTVYFVTDDGETETIVIPSDFKDDALETTVIAVDNQDNRSNTVNIFIETDEEKAALEEQKANAVAPNPEDIHLVDVSELPELSSDELELKRLMDNDLKSGAITQQDYDEYIETVRSVHETRENLESGNISITPPAPSEPSAPSGGVTYDDPTQDPNYDPPDKGWVFKEGGDGWLSY